MSFQILVYFWSTVRVHFPIKESKLVAAIGDSVTLVCSAEGYPLNIEWKKNEPGSTAVIKRKTFLSILEFKMTSESFFLTSTSEGKGKFWVGSAQGPQARDKLCPLVNTLVQ